MFCLTPKSITATLAPSPFICSISFLVTVLTASVFVKASNFDFTSSKDAFSKVIIPFIVPLFLSILVNALVSMPSSPITLFCFKYVSKSISHLKLFGSLLFSLTINPFT